jgi:hypothetical protein
MALAFRRASGAALLAAGALALTVLPAGLASASTIRPDGLTMFYGSGPTPALAIAFADLYAEQEGFKPATQCTNDVFASSGTYYDYLSCIGNNPGGGLP